MAFTGGLGCRSSGAPTPQLRDTPGNVIAVEEFPLVAWFERYDSVFSGVLAQSHPFFPRAIDAVDASHGLRCTGTAPLRQMPVQASPPATCDGMRGVAQLHCSDERVVRLEWMLDPDCRSGFGQGADSEGQPSSLELRRIPRSRGDYASGGATQPKGQATTPRSRHGPSRGNFDRHRFLCDPKWTCCDESPCRRRRHSRPDRDGRR